MRSVLSAESAVLPHGETVGIILLVFHGVVVPLLALVASQCNLNAHFGTSLNCLPVSPYSEKFEWPEGPVRLKMGIEKRPKFTGRDILSQFIWKVKQKNGK